MWTDASEFLRGERESNSERKETMKKKKKNEKRLSLKIRTVDDTTILGAMADELTLFTNFPTDLNCTCDCRQY